MSARAAREQAAAAIGRSATARCCRAIPASATIIEFSHRATSGLALLSVVALLVWTLRATRAGHPARGGAWASLFFILTEAAVGAGLVLFRLVADNATMARALFMAAHLMNTFILVGCLTLTAYWLSGGAPVRVRGAGWRGGAVALGLAALILTGISGAVAALGRHAVSGGVARGGAVE